MNDQALIKWLLEGDISIHYQTHRDLLGEDKKDLQARITTEGWAQRIIDQRKNNGHWGAKFYYPKWTSTHYTLMDLKNMNVAPENKRIRETIQLILKSEKGEDGGILPVGKDRVSEICVSGMFLNYAAYFGTKQSALESIVDFLLRQKMPDGGFNCRLNRSGARHSSVHTTISVLEGISEYQRNEYDYRVKELEKVKVSSIEFLLVHQLFRSDRTGAIINKNFLKIPFPSRWKYDILRALDYFQYAEVPYDDRMQEALDILLKKRNKDGTWNVQAKHPGQVHFDMEKAGKPSRWNTLRALRVLKHFS